MGIKHWTGILVQTKIPTFFAKFCIKFVTFLRFSGFLHKKCLKWLFQPAFGVCSNQMLVKINNINPNIPFYGQHRKQKLPSSAFVKFLKYLTSNNSLNSVKVKEIIPEKKKLLFLLNVIASLLFQKANTTRAGPYDRNQ